jgi:hypothetical protein
MRASALAWLALLAFPAAAQWSGWDYDKDRPKEKLKEELEVKLPAFPKEENLLQFEAGVASSNRFFVDTKALSIGTDGTIRYTLIIKTAGGATNVSYEGMRCGLWQIKVYAVARKAGEWMRARDPQWQRIANRNISHYHSVLYGSYFCASGTGYAPVASVEEILRLIRYGPREPYTN